ncbi:hypothetical protein RJ639_047525 [Escallonia herrerae]|uniref:Uncharacterized protein n=1 Tax=Escallonia herrerae TaxID=1293975 RepID=A0AA89AZY7_9ASTE|nr:hypothetical protein RJ639_047525 [Escallonia herrerae]
MESDELKPIPGPGRDGLSVYICIAIDGKNFKSQIDSPSQCIILEFCKHEAFKGEIKYGHFKRQRDNTSTAFCVSVFDHWETFPDDPLDKSVVLRLLEHASVQHLAQEFVVKTRHKRILYLHLSARASRVYQERNGKTKNNNIGHPGLRH